MLRLRFFLILILSLLFTKKVDSTIECYQCESVEGSQKDCDQGLNISAYRATCPAGADGRDLNYCFKISNNGTYSSKYTTIRGCYHEMAYGGFKEFTDKNLFIHYVRTGKYHLTGRLYICDSNLCNSVSHLKYPFILMVSLFGFFLLNYKTSFGFL